MICFWVLPTYSTMLEKMAPASYIALNSRCIRALVRAALLPSIFVLLPSEHRAIRPLVLLAVPASVAF